MRWCGALVLAAVACGDEEDACARYVTALATCLQEAGAEDDPSFDPDARCAGDDTNPAALLCQAEAFEAADCSDLDAFIAAQDEADACVTSEE